MKKILVGFYMMVTLAFNGLRADIGNIRKIVDFTYTLKICIY